VPSVTIGTSFAMAGEYIRERVGLNRAAYVLILDSYRS